MESADKSNSVDSAERERMGLPSASFLPRLRFCAGSWNMYQSIPLARRQEIADKSGDAKLGTLLHKYIEYYIKNGKAQPDIEAKHQDLCVRVWDHLQVAREKVKFFGADTEIFQETRLPLRNDNFEIVTTGMFDYLELYRAQLACMIGDWKTLWNEHTAPKYNYQLIQYACEVMQKYDWMETFYLVLIQPNLAEGKQLQIAKFTRAQLEYYLEEIYEYYENAGGPDAPRIPGPFQCETCPGRFGCKEALAAALALTDPHFLDIEGVDASLLKRIRKAKKLIGEITTDYEQRAIGMIKEDEDAVPGFGVGRGNSKTTVTSSLEASKRFAPIFDSEEFAQVCSVSVAQAAALYYTIKNAEGERITHDRARGYIELLLEGILKKSRGKETLIEK